MSSTDDYGPVLTPAEATALHERPEPVAWLMLPALDGNGLVARAYTEAHDGGQLLPGHLVANDLEELRAKLPPGLHLDMVFAE